MILEDHRRKSDFDQGNNSSNEKNMNIYRKNGKMYRLNNKTLKMCLYHCLKIVKIKIQTRRLIGIYLYLYNIYVYKDLYLDNMTKQYY